MSPGDLARALDLTTAQARAAVAATRVVVEADGSPLAERSARLFEVVTRGLGVAAGDASDTSLVAEAFPTPSERRALVDALVIAACIEGEVTRPRQRAVEGIARVLGVRSHWVDLLDALRRRRVLAVKRALATHAPDARRLFARTWEEEGVVGMARALVFVAGLHRDRALAARYRALREAPAGSFGRAVLDHFEARGLAFPGEKGGIPERMLHHDLMHVINGYDTDPEGECELAGFYAASADGDAFTFVLIALATFQLELPVSPSVVRPARGAFDPERVLAAFLRGRRLQVDVMGRWDYWELFPLPVAEARARLGIAA